MKPPAPSLRLLAAVALAALLAACATRPRRQSSGPRVLGVQFASVTGNDGYETAEVFLWNDGPSPVSFTNAVLDGASLGGGRERSARAAAGRFRFDIGGQRVAAPKPAGNDSVLCCALGLCTRNEWGPETGNSWRLCSIGADFQGKNPSYATFSSARQYATRCLAAHLDDVKRIR